VINLDTITTNAKKSLQERLVTLSSEKIKAVETALHFALGLEEQRQGLRWQALESFLAPFPGFSMVKMPVVEGAKPL